MFLYFAIKENTNKDQFSTDEQWETYTPVSSLERDFFLLSEKPGVKKGRETFGTAK